MFSVFRRASDTSLKACRRQGIRHPLPVEVQIEVTDRLLEGIVRDVTISADSKGRVEGISLMHFEPLSVHREYICHTQKTVEQLPNIFRFEVRWCRYFEDEAFISGGVVLPVESSEA